MVSLKQIHYYLGVAQAGQVSSAAQDMNVSQSAVTLSIQDLEAELGVKLFVRRSSGLKLTQEGHRFLHHANNIQSVVSDAMNSMRSQDEQCDGKIRLGLTYMLSGYFLFPLLTRFRRAYPKISIELIEKDRASVEELLRTGDVDLALLLTSNLADRESITSVTLLKSPRRLWLSSFHPLLSREKVSFSEVAQEPYVLLRMDEADVSAAKYWKQAGIEPNASFVTDSLEAVRAMVANGFAVTILSDMVYRPWSLDGGKIEVRDMDSDVPSMNMGLAWKRGRRLSKAERIFRDYLVAETTAQGPRAT